MAFKIDIPVLLTKLMDVIPGKQAGLAKALGRNFDQSQVSRWLKGVEPTGTRYDRIIELATEKGVLGDIRSEDVSEMIEPVPKRTVKLKGYVGAGSVGHFYEVAENDLGEVEANDKATDKTAALEIIGSSLGKFFDRWLAYYDDVRRPVTDDLIGQLCVVGLPDNRVLVKKIQRGRKKGRYDLIANLESEEPIKDVEIAWAALVVDLRPNRMKS